MKKLKYRDQLTLEECLKYKGKDIWDYRIFEVYYLNLDGFSICTNAFAIV